MLLQCPRIAPQANATIGSRTDTVLVKRHTQKVCRLDDLCPVYCARSRSHSHHPGFWAGLPLSIPRALPWDERSQATVCSGANTL